jgi:hypothetical protein
MPAHERVTAALAVALLAAIIAALFARRRAGSCVSFVLYLVAVAAADFLLAAWPDRFWKRDFWIFKETVHNLLKLAIALELIVRVFHHFPSAYVSVRRAVMLVVVVLGALVWSSLGPEVDYNHVVGRLNPHVIDATVWLFVALGAYCLWYHLPLDAIHKAILIGFVPYLLFYSVVHRMVVALGWQRAVVLNRTAPFVYLSVLAYWAYVAWKREAGDAATRVRRMMPATGPDPDPR